MENKIELIYIAKNDGTVEMSMKAKLNGMEMLNTAVEIVDYLVTNFTRNSMEKKFFLEIISKTVLELM